MPGASILRFAVGAFDSWVPLHRALNDLLRRGFGAESFNCLAQERIFAQTTSAAAAQLTTVEKLAFAEGTVCCTAGSLHDCLRARLGSGAQSLKQALGLWLVARHAAQFQAAIEAGKIQLWILLANAEDERQAYLSLLACSSNSVGVHDLSQVPRVNGAGNL